MGTHDPRQVTWHTSMLPRATIHALNFLAKEPWIAREGWYLAGGTALALAVGHRSSVDLDFFTQKTGFDPREVTRHFEPSSWHVDIAKEGTLYGRLSGAKASFIAYPFFKPKLPFASYGAVPVLQPQDIATMKIVAISQRGRKRDFLDLYWYAQHCEPLVDVVKRLREQYPTVAHDYHHILKSLTYFVDAENDAMPPLAFKVTWLEIKKYFRREVKMVVRQLMHLL